MGQIFDRISKIVKSGNNKSDSDYIFNNNIGNISEEDELKNIIDNLNNNNNHQSNQSTNNYQYNSSEVDIDKAYSTLKINAEANNDDIKTAYKNRIKEYHPDKTTALGDEIQKIAKIKTQEINEAYSLLKKLRNF